MANIVSYEERPAEPFITIKDETQELYLIPGILAGLLFAGAVLWLTKKASSKNIGEGTGLMDKGFAAALGISGGAVSGIPVKYVWIPAFDRMGRGHPASLNFEFTVRNPRNLWMRVHKEGFFHRPMGSLPPQTEAPPLIESHGYVLRVEPRGALADAGAVLDAGIAPLCGAGLYEAGLKGNKFSISLLGSETYEIEEARSLLEAAVKAAHLFN